MPSIDKEKKMSFLGHLQDFRKHLLRVFVGVLLGSFLILFNKEKIFEKIIFAPAKSQFITYNLLNKLTPLFGEKISLLEDLTIQNRTLLGQFNTYIWVCFIGGIILGFPYLIYELWCFIKPAFSQKEKKYIKIVLFLSFILFFLGLLFGYFILLPFIIQFACNFSLGGFAKNIFDLSNYISIFIQSTLSMGLIFLFPIFIYFLTKAGFIDNQFLKTYRKHAFLVIFIISSLLTPSDVLSTILVAIPLYLLYELSIFSSSILEKRNK